MHDAETIFPFSYLPTISGKLFGVHEIAVSRVSIIFQKIFSDAMLLAINIDHCTMRDWNVLPESLISSSELSDRYISMIGYMYKSSENLSYTVYKCQQAKITLLFVPTSIFTFLYTTDVQ